MAKIIVLGNEKGGSGKSTTAMHLIVALAKTKKKVAVIDLDLRQKTLYRYLENRDTYCKRHKIKLPTGEKIFLKESQKDSKIESLKKEEKDFSEKLFDIDQGFDYLVIDCPGSHTNYSQMAHAVADLLITPMNDSLIDFDLLAKIDPKTGKILGPSIYSEMVWSARQVRARSEKAPIDWVVIRNRMSQVYSRNKRRVNTALDDLSKRIGFRLASGFSDRVVFKELFLSGLTLMDLTDSEAWELTLSNIAARQELRELLSFLGLSECANSI